MRKFIIISLLFLCMSSSILYSSDKMEITDYEKVKLYSSVLSEYLQREGVLDEYSFLTIVDLEYTFWNYIPIIWLAHKINTPVDNYSLAFRAILNGYLCTFECIVEDWTEYNRLTIYSCDILDLNGDKVAEWRKEDQVDFVYAYYWYYLNYPPHDWVVRCFRKGGEVVYSDQGQMCYCPEGGQLNLSDDTICE